MFVNLTPHSITVLTNVGITQDPTTKVFLASADKVGIIKEIPPSGEIARVTAIEKEIGIIDEIPIKQVEWGEITGLPPETDGVYFIVSSVVMQAAKVLGRNDVLAPGALVRDENNKSAVLGCLFFTK